MMIKLSLLRDKMYKILPFSKYWPRLLPSHLSVTTVTYFNSKHQEDSVRLFSGRTGSENPSTLFISNSVSGLQHLQHHLRRTDEETVQLVQ